VVDVVLARYFTAPWRARHPDRVAELRAAIAATPAAGYVACCGAIERMDLRADLAAIRAPTLAIAGADDPSTPPDHLRRIAGAIAGARVAVVADAAHVANLEQPQVVTDLIEQHLHSGDEDMNKLRKEAGMRVRREVLGDEHVDRAIAKTTPFTADFQDFITQVAWGDVWTRPDLDRRTRSCITLAMLTALGREHEIALHVRGAVRNGVSGREIAEVLIHAAVYAGIPAANRAFQIAEAVLNEIAAENVAPEK
jgi:3-oxoadipate enol-lactonase/4-carboxymuconolactone decarboxylase